MLDFTGSDAVRQSTKSAVGRGVRVAANYRHARQGGAVFRADHMHDALAFGQKRKISRSTKLLHIAVQGHHLLFAGGVGDPCIALLPACGGRVVVRCGDDGTVAPDRATSLTQALKGLRAGNLVHQVAVYVEDGGAIFLGVDNVRVPQFVVEGASHVFPSCCGILSGCRYPVLTLRRTPRPKSAGPEGESTPLILLDAGFCAVSAGQSAARRDGSSLKKAGADGQFCIRGRRSFH